MKQMLEEKGIIVGRRRGLDEAGTSSPVVAGCTLLTDVRWCLHRRPLPFVISWSARLGGCPKLTRQAAGRWLGRSVRRGSCALRRPTATERHVTSAPLDVQQCREFADHQLGSDRCPTEWT